MIKFSHVSLIYPNSTTTVLEDLNLTIAEGELVLVIGPTGSGKSSFHITPEESLLVMSASMVCLPK